VHPPPGVDLEDRGLTLVHDARVAEIEDNPKLVDPAAVGREASIA
jgi:hypothetical protein